MKKIVFSLLILVLLFFATIKTFSSLDTVWTRTLPIGDLSFSVAKFSPNSKMIAAGLSIPDYFNYTQVIIYNTATGDTIRLLRGHKGLSITSIVWFNDSILATGDNDNYNENNTRTVRIWNVNTGENLYTLFDDTTQTYPKPYPTENGIRNLVYFKSKNRLFIDLYSYDYESIINPPYRIYRSDSVLVYNTNSFSLIKPICFSGKSQYNQIKLICGDPNGKWYLLSENGVYQIRNSETDALIKTLDTTFQYGFDKISPDGKYGVSIVQDISIYNLEDFTFLKNFKIDSVHFIMFDFAYDLFAPDFIFSPDSKYIAGIGIKTIGGKSVFRFGIAEIENSNNQKWFEVPDETYILDASNDSLYILFTQQSTLLLCHAPWSPFKSVAEKPLSDKFEINIIPNPAGDYISISVGANGCSPESIKIFDVFGQEYLTPTLSTSGEGVRIDVSALPPGVYFVRVGDKVSKFVKV